MTGHESSRQHAAESGGTGSHSSRRELLRTVSAATVGGASTGSVAAFDRLVDRVFGSEPPGGQWVLRVENPLSPAMDGPSTAPAARETAHAAQQQVLAALENRADVSVLNRFWAANAVLVEADTVGVDELRATAGVRTVHPNFEVTAPEPVDHTRLSVLSETTYGLQQVDAPDVWEAFDTLGEGARVAVLDTGAHASHADIEVDGWLEVDTNGDPVDSAPHDPNGHGTHVAGTAVGRNEGLANIGVAPGAEHYHAKVFPAADRSTTFAAIVAGMGWAAAVGADVMNMSLGSDGFAPAFLEPVQTVKNTGTLVVASSGNQGAGESGSPGNVSESAAVGATDPAESVAEFSGGQQVYTPGDWGFSAPPSYPTWYVVPDVTAPGVDVRSAATNTEGGYELRSGTSMAAPHATGILALASAADPEMTPGDLADLLGASAFHPEGVDTAEPRYGTGIASALNAVTRRLTDGLLTGTATLESVDGETLAAAGTAVQAGFGTRDVVTDESGYELPVPEGDRTVEASTFGFETTESVTVTGTTSVELTLDAVLSADTGGGQPPNMADGSSLEFAVDVAHVAELTVDLAGDLAGQADPTRPETDVTVEVSVGGEQVPLGETLTFEEPFTARGVPVMVTVSGAPDGSELVLEHTFAGLGETLTLTTGPTTVKQDPEPALFTVAEANLDDTVGEDGLLASTAVVENSGDLTGGSSVFFRVDDIVTGSGLPVEQLFEFPVELGPGESALLRLGPVSFGAFPRQEGTQTLLTADPDEPDDTVEGEFLVEGPLYELLGVDTPDTVERGATFTAAVGLGNTGEMDGNGQFTLEFAGRAVASVVEPVPAGSEVSVDVTVATDGLPTGSYDHAVVPEPAATYGDPTPVAGEVELVERDGPPPLPGFEDPPMDLDGDGRFEDIDGDGEFTVFDVQAFFQRFESDPVQTNVEFFDFDGDGAVTIFDVQELFERL